MKTDSYLSSIPNYLVTNDKHFNVLKRIDFPKLALLDMTAFKEILNK